MNGSRLQFARFLVGGTVNTCTGYGLFLVLSWWLPPSAAYSVTYVFGVAFSYAINTFFVFRTRASVGSAARFPLAYLLSYLVGLALLTALTGAGLDSRIAMVVVMAVNVPLTFVMTRRVLRGGTRAPEDDRASRVAAPRHREPSPR
ncbi:GtrA family protein [Streptosporangium carneum]|uniref:GtrA/DPMS transmembrane domain-containing protein n=1 Tax=Streptosporangium carneum TaxID=47481 RepID=A0A9W6IAY3_9ACTN|nr:GtrA family protein [Streptosporangium carneum]GLK15330.1 hypothetical protein GCM10017600_87430 [Streptosporangium carneum]